MDTPDWFRSVALDKLGPAAAAELYAAVDQLTDEDIGRQDRERTAAAILVLVIQYPANIEEIVLMRHGDWRDLLVGGGLGHDDWPSRLRDLKSSWLSAE